MAAAEAPPTGHDGFGNLVRAEWTKLRTVPRWVGGLVGAVVVTVLVAALAAGGSSNQQVGGGGGSGPSLPPDYRDEFHFVHRPLTGDGEVAARVASQEDSHEWAKAGLLLKDGTDRGAPYAAVMVTPDHGVRLQAEFTTDIAGDENATAPRWLRLARDGDVVTGYESADGEDWRRVGTVEVDGLPETVQVGLFVTSPNRMTIERQFGGESISEVGTEGEATFDEVTVDGEPATDWADHDGSMLAGQGGSTRAGGTFTVTGAGDIGPYAFPDDVVEGMLQNVITGLLAVVAVSTLFVTSEYRRGLIRTTFAAAPARGRVLAAKAVVIGGVAAVVGLVTAFGIFLLGRPAGLPVPPLSDGAVLRAVLGTAPLVALVALLSLGAGAALRHSAGAVTAVIVLVVVPQVVATGLPLSAATWLQRVTPTAGFAILETLHRYDSAIGPWAGLAVLAAYAAAALAFAHWQLRRRDA